MWASEDIKEYLKANLKVSRYNHVLGVVDTSIKLANIYGYDVYKAEIAALGHDVAKNMTNDELKNIICENNIKLSVDEENTKELWHSIVGPVVANKVFEIEDLDILNAIRWHTTGRENMSNLEKIIYLADLIEPSRIFDGVEDIRNIAYKDLDLAMLKALTHTTVYLLNKGLTVDINSIKARNYLIYNKINK